MNEDASAEFNAFKAVHDALEPLSEDARGRVIKSVTTLLGIHAHLPLASPSETTHPSLEEEEKGNRSFSNLAELFDAATPGPNSEKALLAGYWIQVEGGADSFTSQEVNKELRNLGHKIGHITSAISALQSTKPQLVFQLKKSGTSQQARKTFKISDAGVKRVHEMTGK